MASPSIPTLPPKEALILDLLVDEGELYGLQLVAASKGRLKRGTVYVTLGRMQDKGYVESRTEPLPAGAIGLPRRWYRPTAYGLRVMEAWAMAARTFAAVKGAVGEVSGITDRSIFITAQGGQIEATKLRFAAGKKLAAPLAAAEAGLEVGAVLGQ